LDLIADRYGGCSHMIWCRGLVWAEWTAKMESEHMRPNHIGCVLYRMGWKGSSEEVTKLLKYRRLKSMILESHFHKNVKFVKESERKWKKVR
jgi:hypothetical protein